MQFETYWEIRELTAVSVLSNFFHKLNFC